jgi:hypothetical protein
VKPVIYAADIGSIAQGNFGWARIDPRRGQAQVERDRGGAEFGDLVEAVATDLVADKGAVALGFECPLDNSTTPVGAEHHAILRGVVAVRS